MGYSVDMIEGGDIDIPAVNLGALQAELTGRSFDWIGEVPVGEDPGVTLANYGFEVLENKAGGLTVYGWVDQKIGDDFDEMLGLLAAHADPTPVTWTMQGEDGEMWALRFKDGICQQLPVVLTVVEPGDDS